MHGASFDTYNFDDLFLTWTPTGGTLNPGEGAIFRNNGQTSIPITFLGELPQGYTSNPVPNGQSIRSTIIPEAGRVVRDLLLPVVNGDTIQRMINGSYTTYTYNNSVWSPSEPIIPFGESFWANKNVGFYWTRNFLIWP